VYNARQSDAPTNFYKEEVYMPHHQAHAMSGEMEQCIENCLDCHRVCERTAVHCTHMGGKHAEPTHLRLLRDCAQICITSADFMLRESDVHPQVCGVCADVCARCAESCEQFSDDAQMKECADICRRCAESCQQMAGTAMPM
jgi:hypothetical protein